MRLKVRGLSSRSVEVSTRSTPPGAAVGPVLPEFVRGLPQPQLWLSVGTGLFLGVQLFSAPLLGRLGDGYGRRPIFIVSAVGTLRQLWMPTQP